MSRGNSSGGIGSPSFAVVAGSTGLVDGLAGISVAWPPVIMAPTKSAVMVLFILLYLSVFKSVFSFNTAFARIAELDSRDGLFLVIYIHRQEWHGLRPAFVENKETESRLG